MNQTKFTASKDPWLYNHACNLVEEKLRRSLDTFTDRYTHVSEGLRYAPVENIQWTAAFYPGMVYTAYRRTGDSAFLRYAEKYLDSYTDRLDRRAHISHDLGFLYTLSSVALHKLTGNERAHALALRAADMLAERYNEKGHYIQAWGEMGIGYPHVKIIIDTMLNLPLLYWSGNPKHFEIAENHAKTSAKYLIRQDYTSFHTYLMNPETGIAVEGRTHQGYRDESTWARGQAWAVYGYALSYRYTKNERFLTIARECARVFLANLPANTVPYWDFSFSDALPDIRDTSAAAIFLCGLLELCEWVEPEEAERYRHVVDTVLGSLYENYLIHDPNQCGLLREGMYHRAGGVNECTSWGDYFFYEALARLTGEWERFW